MALVDILFGGTSSERKVSCASAQHFSEVLPEAQCLFWSEDGRVLKVDPDELRSHQDVFKSSFQPQNILGQWPSVDHYFDGLKSKDVTILNSLHGGDGENGTIQNACESRSLPFTGSGSAASQLAMDKVKAKQFAKSRGVQVAEQLTFASLGSTEELVDFQKKFGRIVLKPATEGSSAGLAFIETSDQLQLWIQTNKESKLRWLCEEMLIGREFTIGVMMYEGSLMVLPPSEVILERNARFDYDGKYLGVGNKEITPADLSPKLTSLVQETVIIAHAALGCYGYTRSEVILTSRGPVYLETNTLPGFTKKSFIPQQLAAANIPVKSFVESQLRLARERYT